MRNYLQLSIKEDINYAKIEFDIKKNNYYNETVPMEINKVKGKFKGKEKGKSKSNGKNNNKEKGK